MGRDEDEDAVRCVGDGEVAEKTSGVVVYPCLGSAVVPANYGRQRSYACSGNSLHH